MDAVDILKAARDDLAENGVARRMFTNADTGQHCTWGALNAAAGLEASWYISAPMAEQYGHPAIAKAARALANEVSITVTTHLTEWNDHSTDDEIIRTFDWAIKRLADQDD